MNPGSDQSLGATYSNQQIHLDGPADWPEGTKLVVTPLLPLEGKGELDGQVIIVGFGLAGRCVA